jgi:hypothetical protein
MIHHCALIVDFLFCVYSSYKNLEKFYTKVVRCISYAKDPNVENSPLPITSALPICPNDNSETQNFTRTEMRVDSVESLSTCSDNSSTKRKSNNKNEIVYFATPAKESDKAKQITTQKNKNKVLNGKIKQFCLN